MKSRFKLLAPVAVAFAMILQLPAHCAGSLTDDAERKRLRNETALHYFSPRPHLELARYYYDRGERVQAFYISENARHMFEDEKFTPSFYSIAASSLKSSPSYLDLIDTPPFTTEKLLSKSAADQQEVERSIEAILAEFPSSLGPKALAARFYLKIKKDEARALPLYIDLYFDNPHYYDGEYAEFRVKSISRSNKEAWWLGKKKSGKPLSVLVGEEANPRLLDSVLDEAHKKWQSSLVAVMFSLLDNDDSYIQSGSLHVLLDHCGDVSKATDVAGMLKSEDWVKRAMAAFLVVKCLGPSRFGLLIENLNSDIELVQLDTIQALASVGGEEGVRYLKANRPEKLSERMETVLRDLLPQVEDDIGAQDAYRETLNERAKVIEAGEFRLSGLSSTKPAGGSGFWRGDTKARMRLAETSPKVRAELGISFGFRYRVRGLSEGRVKTFELQAIHPPMTGPDGRTTTLSRAVTLVTGESEDYTIGDAVFTLGEPYQVLAGKWVIQVLDRGQVVLRQEFDLE